MSDIHAYLTATENGGCQLTVSWGEKPSGGYHIAIKDTKLLEGILEVSVEAHRPAPDAFVSMALTYPKATLELFNLPQGTNTPIHLSVHIE